MMRMYKAREKERILSKRKEKAGFKRGTSGREKKKNTKWSKRRGWGEGAHDKKNGSREKI